MNKGKILRQVFLFQQMVWKVEETYCCIWFFNILWDSSGIRLQWRGWSFSADCGIWFAFDHWPSCRLNCLEETYCCEWFDLICWPSCRPDCLEESNCCIWFDLVFWSGCGAPIHKKTYCGLWFDLIHWPSCRPDCFEKYILSLWQPDVYW